MWWFPFSCLKNFSQTPSQRKYQSENGECFDYRPAQIIGILPPGNYPPDQWEIIDCLQISDPLEWKKSKNRVFSIQKDGVILKHFECQFGFPRFDQAKRELLAALLAKDKQIRVLSTINPLKFARGDAPAPSSPDESKRPTPVSLRQWSQVFQSFTLRYHKLETSKSASSESSYEAIWQARTVDEKIALHHLERDGFVHAENSDLPALFELGLIKSKPKPRWFEEDGFEEYVLNAAQRDRLDTKEHVKGQVWKWPLAIVLIVLGMGLLLTQKELYNGVVLMLSLLPVLLPTLSELIRDPNNGGNAT